MSLFCLIVHEACVVVVLGSESYAYDRIVLYGLLGISGRALPTSIDLPKLR